MSVTDRLVELGIVLPAPATPQGSYLPAVRSGSYVYTSGQVPMVDGSIPTTGVVGAKDGQVSPERAKELARVCVLNALTALTTVVSLDDIRRVVKVVGFVASDPEFTGQPGVINGASDLLAEVFGEAGRHARSAVGVAALPLGSPVEVELIVEV